MSERALAKAESSFSPSKSHLPEKNGLLGHTPTLKNALPSEKRLVAHPPLAQVIQSVPCQSCPLPVQAKLTINKPGDLYEQEADRIADQVMRMPEPRVQRQVDQEEEEEEETIQTKPLANQIVPIVQRQVDSEEEDQEPIQTKALDSQILIQRQIDSEDDEEEESIQAKEQAGNTPTISPGIQSQIQSIRGGGQPLSQSERSFFEPRFGYDFSRVRVHNNLNAARMARAINARAFTFGNNIVFGHGQYTPRTNYGKHLIAHELAHIAQVGGGKLKDPKISNSKNKWEIDAEPSTLWTSSTSTYQIKQTAPALIFRSPLVGLDPLHPHREMEIQRRFRRLVEENIKHKPNNFIKLTNEFYEGLKKGLSTINRFFVLRFHRLFNDPFEIKFKLGLLSGIVVGVYEDLLSTLSNLPALFDLSRNDIDEFLLDFVNFMFSPDAEKIAYISGVKIGQEWVQPINIAMDMGDFSFGYYLGKHVGPIFVQIVLSSLVIGSETWKIGSKLIRRLKAMSKAKLITAPKVTFSTPAQTSVPKMTSSTEAPTSAPKMTSSTEAPTNAPKMTYSAAAKTNAIKMTPPKRALKYSKYSRKKTSTATSTNTPKMTSSTPAQTSVPKMTSSTPAPANAPKMTSSTPALKYSRKKTSTAPKEIDKSSGLEYALSRHGIFGEPGKSRFMLSEEEVIEILKRKEVISSPAYYQSTRGVPSSSLKKVKVPPRVQSRINIRIKFKETGKGVKQERKITKKPGKHSRRVEGQRKTTIKKVGKHTFARQINLQIILGLKEPIGIDIITGKKTYYITIITDEYGNLVNVFPGVIKKP